MEQIKRRIAVGDWAEGHALPSIRQLAVDLQISVITVKRAYLELERAGVVTKRHGSGTYVSESPAPLSRREKFKVLNQRADALLVEAGHFDIDLDEVIAVVHERYEAMHSQPKK